MHINIKNLKNVPLPTHATDDSAGVDLTAAIDAPIILGPGKRTLVPTGLAIGLPQGYEAQIRPRSGLAIKHGISILNTPGTIDADYRGEIIAIVINHGEESFVIEPGMRIAQMVISAYERISWNEVEDLDDTTRGHNRFGSTGC